MIASDQFRPASWRGIPFEVTHHSVTFGRRLAVHNYPDIDDPYVVDVGRSSPEFSITAFLHGADVAYQRNQFIRAAEEFGSGILIHPSLGTMTVRLRSCAVKESFEENGYVCLDLTFVESIREYPFEYTPNPRVDDKSDTAFSALIEFSSEELEEYADDGDAAKAREEAVQESADMMSEAVDETPFSGDKTAFSEAVSDLKKNAGDLLKDAVSLFDKCYSLVSFLESLLGAEAAYEKFYEKWQSTSRIPDTTANGNMLRDVAAARYQYFVVAAAIAMAKTASAAEYDS